MDETRIIEIIREETSKVINEKKDKGDNKGIASLIDDYFKNHKKKKKNMKIRKTIHGGKEYYDYDDYQRSNKKVSAGDASTIRNTIDTEKTNMAAIARELFPSHTEEGAQSQFRKIIRGERPMTQKIASKIEKFISRGQIAVK
jgi:hypothetical protein